MSWGRTSRGPPPIRLAALRPPGEAYRRPARPSGGRAGGRRNGGPAAGRGLARGLRSRCWGRHRLTSPAAPAAGAGTSCFAGSGRWSCSILCRAPPRRSTWTPTRSCRRFGRQRGSGTPGRRRAGFRDRPWGHDLVPLLLSDLASREHVVDACSLAAAPGLTDQLGEPGQEQERAGPRQGRDGVDAIPGKVHPYRTSHRIGRLRARKEHSGPRGRRRAGPGAR